MTNIYERASQILSNLKLTSDNVDMADCYYLCANKQHIVDLLSKDHQIIWGRRGTGKTTLMKAFSYNINYILQDPNSVAIYIVMAKVIPTEGEIATLTGDGSSLAIYVFSKLIGRICDALEDIYSVRAGVIDSDADKKFLDSFYKLQDYLEIYQTCIQGGELSVDNLKSSEIKKELGSEVGTKINATEGIFKFCMNLFRNKNKTSNYKQSFAITGKIQFVLETEVISNLISQMLDALGITLAYICLDEYSEMDKISEFSIQSKVAQLIKQVFFKDARYSVKIATIWSRSKLHTRGGNRVEGIEYQQDIFGGPDLDIMFMEHNADVISYFKEVLVNTYLMGQDVKDEEKNALSDYIESDIFSELGLRHLICGSQGVSRTFVILVKTYLQRFIKGKNGPVKLGTVYEIIKHHYLEDVRNKIPYYTLYKSVDKYLSKNLCRYFLFTRDDYNRCKTLIKYLASRGVFMQMPGHLTDREIRDEYKLFVVHYGNYLDALESASSRRGRKTLDEDAKLEADGMLVPEYSCGLIDSPETYTVHIPENAEKEAYCTECRKIIVDNSKGNRVICPHCGHEMLRFGEFIDEVAL